MGILVGAIVLAVGWMVIRQLVAPSCPRCGSKKWDRKLCHPLLFCRKCATRVDQHGRVYN
jgi:hypothetical protein